MTHFDRSLLIHVAAESERRGRVVLASQTADPHPALLEATFAVAGAFETWVECLIVECPEVAALTAHDFARSISHTGHIARLSTDSVKEAQAASTISARQIVLKKAHTSGVRISTTVTRDSLIDALARACALEGPWNLVALAEPARVSDGLRMQSILDRVHGATAIVCVGPQASTSWTQRTARGAVVIVIEDLERLPQMLRAAERLAQSVEGAKQPISIVTASGTPDDMARIDGHLRLLLAGGQNSLLPSTTRIEPGTSCGSPDELAETLRRLNGRFVIARCGGIVMPSNGDPAAVLSVLKGPLMLVR